MIGMTVGFYGTLKKMTETKSILKLTVPFSDPQGYLFP